MHPITPSACGRPGAAGPDDRRLGTLRHSLHRVAQTGTGRMLTQLILTGRATRHVLRGDSRMGFAGRMRVDTGTPLLGHADKAISDVTTLLTGSLHQAKYTPRRTPI